MTLPKIFNPIYDIKIPSLKKTSKFRQFTVKEEKILLMAKESTDESDRLNAIAQVVTNCSMDNNFDIKKIAIFDLEYIFLKLRMYSIDNICKVSYEVDEEGTKKEYPFEIDLNSVEVKFPENLSNNIPITSSMGIMMKYPSASLYMDDEFLAIKEEKLYNLILRCIDKIYEGEDIYEAKDYSMKEISDFVENLSPKVYEKVMIFLTQLPTLYHELSYKNFKGEEKKIILRSLSDFFTLR